MLKQSRLRIAVGLALLLAGLAVVSSLTMAQEEQGGGLAALDPPAQPTVVRLYVNDRAHLNEVAGVLDIWETHREESYVVAQVTPEQYRWLEGLGYRLEVDATERREVAGLPGLDPRFHYFDAGVPNANGLYVVDFLQGINATYPGLTELVDIGDAWVAGQPGQWDRDIWVLRITNEDPDFGPVDQKPPFFVMATIHAREVAVPELAIRYIKYLTEGFDGEGGYGVDPDVTWLVDHHVAYMLVMQNPDGHAYNELDPGNNRRKNLDSDDGCTTLRDLGVDLNRNHSFFWSCCGGSSGSPCEITYRGPSPGSEPETQAFQAYFASVMEDRNGPNGDNEIPPAAPDDTAGVFVSLHSYSDIVLWPWAFAAYGDSPNSAQLETIGRKFAYFNGYSPEGTIWHDIDGATDDWTYGKFGVASFTFEVGAATGECAGFFPRFACIDGIEGSTRSFWAENKPAFLYAHQIARTPYLTSYGPDTSAVTAAMTAVRQGTPVSLTALVEDHRLAGDAVGTIGGAEYFVDTPAADGTGAAMVPADGAWGGLSESVTATLDTSSMSGGRHYILVHGENEDGFWGPLAAVFLDVWLPGDFNNDGAVGQDDYGDFALCISGPGVTTPPDGCPTDLFERGDLDADSDVDLDDVAAFEAILAE